MKLTNIKPYLAEKCQVGLLFLRDKLIKFFSIFMYQTLYKMPLGKYIGVVVDNDFTYLLRVPWIIGIPVSIFCPLSAYLSQFGKLQVEYSELSGNKEYQSLNNRRAEITFIQYQIFFYSHSLKLIIDSPNSTGALEFLSKNGFEGTIEEIANALSGELMGLKSNLDDLEALEKTNAPTAAVKVTRADYAKTIDIASMNGHYVDYKTSVGDFIHKLSNQKEEISRLNNKK